MGRARSTHACGSAAQAGLVWVARGSGNASLWEIHVSVSVNWIFSKCGIPPMHWFAFAQKPTRNWVKLINQAIPRPKLKPAQALAVNQWVPSDDIQ